MSRANRIAAVRRFNRFYTQRIGVLDRRILDSPWSLSEARVLWELAHEPDTAATRLTARLDMDAGQLSRILQRFRRRRLVVQQRAPGDGRKKLLHLTCAGRAAFARIDAGSRREIAGLLAALDARQQDRLVAAMQGIETLLEAPAGTPAYVLRPPRAGDLGWVVERHGAIYAAEYAWDERFEALVAQIVGDFGARHDPRRERCLIAERDGENVGCVFVVAKSRTIAQLRLLLVDPRARGLGIGARLVDECVRFARAAGYRRLRLWTNDVLVSARRLYIAAGFHRIAREHHRSFGHRLVGETWELVLSGRG